MRALFIRWLRALLVWLGEPAGLQTDPALLQMARVAVAEAGRTPHTGAYKAVIALKALMKIHPGIRRRDLRLAIEHAVQELP